MMLMNKNYAFDRLVQFAEFYGFTEITLFDGSVEWDNAHLQLNQLPYAEQLEVCIRKLNSRGIGVNLAFYLNDDINNMAGWEQVEVIA